MSEQFRVKRRRKSGKGLASRPVRAAFERPLHGGSVAAAYPGFSTPDDEGRKRRFLTGGIATLVHLGAIGMLVFFASLSPIVQEQLIPVQLLHEELQPPPPPPEPAAAPKALAERRPLPFAPAVQAVAPQIVNPRVIAEASPAIEAEALQMDAVSNSAAPTQISRSVTVVERVSAVNSVAQARAAAVDVENVGAPVVRGPTRVDMPVGPSVGPRQVTAAAVAPTVGTARQIGGTGSSVAEGVVSTRDVVGSPEGAIAVAVDTSIGDGLLRGSGAGSGTSVVSQKACVQRPEVQHYMADVKSRMLERWVLPPGVDPDMEVKLRFRLDAAGSASNIAIVRAGDNALGASAVDALRAASPFPPMSDEVRCLTQSPLIGTFSNPNAG